MLSLSLCLFVCQRRVSHSLPCTLSLCLSVCPRRVSLSIHCILSPHAPAKIDFRPFCPFICVKVQVFWRENISMSPSSPPSNAAPLHRIGMAGHSVSRSLPLAPRPMLACANNDPPLSPIAQLIASGGADLEDRTNPMGVETQPKPFSGWQQSAFQFSWQQSAHNQRFSLGSLEDMSP